MPTALVTGAGRGIGEAVALRLAASGWTVFAGVRAAAEGERLAARNTLITPVELDVTESRQVEALLDRLPHRLDAVVNNAGIGVLGPVEAISIEDFRRQFEVNVFGQVAVTQAVLPKIREAAGRIVFISSTGGRTAVTMEGAYCSSKFAIEGLADVLRVELRPWEIDVVVVEPGPTDTTAWRTIDGALDDMEAKLSPHHRELYAAHLAGMRKLVGVLRPRTVSPDVVARTVERALTAPRPRARYAAGVQAAAMVAMGQVLPTRAWDALAARLGGWK
ncbi:SDR family oxidoreductase [Aestuariimicrobium sp. T2.26MG-19.2B]|uniref:SDR family oxidoreductase n=1 Tax=Aestuariimicrobium sp. T2.26MG-19.2B TaxID=3040679 RepID=UPI002477B89B|nr:SDR family oxidoreductase [Aestuariimicrobium sp. T2.26MG-19.2B]CAI9403171.1 3-phenylpropionate-dihydrodiol/cinnamic acid-dihydrodiol dehydrogenase [Aestuariimicrobium sp. T2.26MG-19.2B]